MKTPNTIVIVLALHVSFIPEAFCYVVSLADTNVAVMENDGGVTASVLRAGSGMGVCSIVFRTVPGSAFQGWDYVAITGRIEFAEDQTLAQAVVPLIPDTIPEPSKYFSILLDAGSNCTPMGLTNSTLIIRDAQALETMARDFESGLPSGWSITTNANMNGYWRFDGLVNWGNATGGRGSFVIADNCNYIEPMDTELRTPPFQVAATALTYLVFKTDYLAGGSDIADVDVSGYGENGPWINMWRKNSWTIRGRSRRSLI